jgi:adenine-specific DNA-methyltransferase
MVTVKDSFKSYYTKSSPIIAYMLNKLCLKEGLRIFEPCAGDGVFIDSIVTRLNSVTIDAYELNIEAYTTLTSKSYPENVTLKLADTLTSEELYLYAQSGGIYDRIIANPPYGAWQSYERRKLLKKLYPELYVKETYSLFLYRCLQLLKDEGVLVFIVPDTFLNLHLHTPLRKYLLNHAKIIEIALIPSNFFPGVNFGYANLAIVTLQKNYNREECLSHYISVLKDFSHVEDLELTRNIANRIWIQQKKVYQNLNHSLFVSDTSVIELLNNTNCRVGDVADCVTGFYSGNDTRYLRPLNFRVKNSKNYPELGQNLVSQDFLHEENLLEGLEGEQVFIPIVKGGGAKYWKSDQWFVDWSKEALTQYKTSKKARFQNSSYYFKLGIGVPMVSSKQITSTIIEEKIFDQSIVGVFPKDSGLLYYLLAFFNSSTCNKLIRTINPSANNPANYIKKIPLKLPSPDLLFEINKKVQEIIIALKLSENTKLEQINSLDKLIKEVYGF